MERIIVKEETEREEEKENDDGQRTWYWLTCSLYFGVIAARWMMSVAGLFSFLVSSVFFWSVFVSFPVTDGAYYYGAPLSFSLSIDGNRRHLAYLGASAVQDRRGKVQGRMGESNHTPLRTYM